MSLSLFPTSNPLVLKNLIQSLRIFLGSVDQICHAKNLYDTGAAKHPEKPEERNILKYLKSCKWSRSTSPIWPTAPETKMDGLHESDKMF